MVFDRGVLDNLCWQILLNIGKCYGIVVLGNRNWNEVSGLGEDLNSEIMNNGD